MGCMRVAVFGGSFDPPHLGHQLAALYVLETFPVDALWLVPVYRHAFDKPLSPFSHRLAMCHLVAESLGPRVFVSTVEQDLAGPSYTLNTIRRLQAEFPGAEFSLVIGSDLLKERERWHGFSDLSVAVRFLVLSRGGAEADSTALRLPTDEWPLHPMTLPEVSSTLVRAALRRGEKPTGLVSLRVLNYIHRHGLYAEHKEQKP